MVQFSSPLKFSKDLWDPSHRFETSWLLPPYALCAIRALFGIYGLCVQFIQLAWYCTVPGYGGCAQSANEFSYFTVLTYWGLAFYNLTAAVHTFTYARTGTPLLDRFPRPLQALHSFFYTTIVVYPFIVTIVYWGIIFPGVWYTQQFDAFSNISQHGMNSFFALFEIVVPRTALPPWIHAWWCVFTLALYLSLAYVTYYTKGFYPYSFLDIQKNGSAIVAAYIVGIAVAAVVIYSLVRGMIWLRLYLTEKKGHMEGRFAGQPLRSHVDMDTEMGTYRNDERDERKTTHSASSPTF